LLGKVLELIVGFDGKVRSVRLKRADGVVAHHSIVHLYPLEISSAPTVCQGEHEVQEAANAQPEVAQPCDTGVSSLNPGSGSIDRPRRAAALRQRSLMRQLIEEEDI